MNEEDIKKLVEEELAKKLSKQIGFIARKLTDTPTDSLSFVNRRFVTLNGVVADRPRSSVATIGQSYFATNTNIPMTFDGNMWRNGVGSIVASNRN